MVLIVVTFVLMLLTRVFSVVILVAFVTPALLPETAILLTVKTAPLFGMFVNPDPSPTNFAEIVPAEIEEKEP